MRFRKALLRIMLSSLPAMTTVAYGEVVLPHLLASHMVLQRDEPVHLWGWADPGEQVSAELNGSTQTTVANRLGEWDLNLPKQKAGGPYSLKIQGKDAVVLDDILIGDVWFASGQSNMEMPLSGFPGAAVVANAADEIRNANHPNIRLFLAQRKGSDFPLRQLEGTWAACSPETAAKFSAVAYFFGREIAEHEHVPIGLIDSTWGGTPAEAWTSMHGLASDSSLMPVFATWAEMADQQADVPRMREAEQREDEAAKEAHQAPPHHDWHPDPASWQPASLFNGMVAPACPLRIKGVIWYQGESNSGAARAPLYSKLFPALITDWRTQWHEGALPFLFVQISSFTSVPEEHWPIIREAQRRTLSLANTGMAVTTDIGNPENVHPADKQDVGARLALTARALVYGENIEYSGPFYRETSSEAGALRVWFDHVSGGLVAKGDRLTGFEIAASDHHFVPAAARIDGNTVLVNAAGVASPKFVRYGWENAPVVNLYNGAGLPASPFTSEDEIPPQ